MTREKEIYRITTITTNENSEYYFLKSLPKEVTNFIINSDKIF